MEHQLTEKQHMMLGVLVRSIAFAEAAEKCNSVEKEQLCNQVHLDKNKTIPLDTIKRMYDDMILELVGNEILIDNNLVRINPEFEPIIEQFRNTFTVI